MMFMTIKSQLDARTAGALAAWVEVGAQAEMRDLETFAV